MNGEVNQNDNISDLLESSNINSQASTGFEKLKNNSREVLNTLSIPGKKDEDWKYTSIKPFLAKGLVLPSGEVRKGIESSKQISHSEERIVLINGKVADDFLNLSEKTSVKIIRSEKDLPEIFLKRRFEKSTSKNTAPKRSSSSSLTFSLLNDYLCEEIIFIEVSDAEVNLEISHIAVPEKDGEFRSPRIFVYSREGSHANITEHFTGYEDKLSVTNYVAEFILEKDARVNHLKIQDEEVSSTLHIASTFIEQDSGSIFKNVDFNSGSSMSRNEIYPSIIGENVESWLIGTNVLSKKQHIDNFTVIDHIAPNCESHELYKGLYADESKGVFSGTIIVQREAQKTNAYQSNASLLLSNDSESYSKPQLKIWADDVKCSHGATIGQIDEEALFYLRARGIPEKKARAILTRAYLADVLSHIEDDLTKSTVDLLLDQKLEKFI